jgi:protein-serine/threonine kinase
MDVPHLSEAIHESTLSDRLQHRDSRALDHRLAIEEEDESTGTASEQEPAEPLTPTSEGTPFSQTLPEDLHVDDVFAAHKSTVPAMPTKKHLIPSQPRPAADRIRPHRSSHLCPKDLD